MGLEQRDIKYMFSNSDLRKLILPLVVEQLLLIAVGLVDSIMIASVIGGQYRGAYNSDFCGVRDWWSCSSRSVFRSEK